MERTSIKTLQVLLRVMRTLDPKADYSIETWAPGDGWTRYRISGNHESTHVSHYMTKAECEQWMRAWILGAETVLGREKVTEIFSERGNPWDSRGAA